MNRPLKIFITYAHTDAEAKDKLIKSLAVMQRSGLIEIWHDTEMLGGDRWQQEIFSTHLPTSDLLLYLVSADSLASENCYEEFEVALEKKIRVVPIIFADCDWINDQISNFQAFPKDGTPINEWVPETKGWQNAVKGIRKTVDTMLSQSEPASGVSEKEREAAVVFQHGNFLLKLGKIDLAIAAYSDVIDLNSRDAFAYSNRGVAYMAKGEFDKAITDHSKAIDLKPDLVAMYNNRGAAYLQKDESDLAIKNFSIAIKLDPKYASAYTNRGAAYADKGEFNKAMTDFNQAIQIDPGDALAYYNRGSGYEKKGQFDKAIKDYNKAIQLNRNYTAAYCNRGGVYSK